MHYHHLETSSQTQRQIQCPFSQLLYLKSEPTTSSSPQEAPPLAEDLVAVLFPDEPLSAESSSLHIRSLIMKLSPPPKSTTPRARKRKAEAATLITGSPFKKVLEEKEQKKSVKKTSSSGKRHDVHEQANMGNKKSKINGERKAEVEKKKDGHEQGSRPKSKSSVEGTFHCRMPIMCNTKPKKVRIIGKSARIILKIVAHNLQKFCA